VASLSRMKDTSMGWFIIVLMFFPFVAQADDVTVSKRDGKYFAELHIAGSDWSKTVPEARRFIDSLTLEVTWWGLLGQPVYYHTLTWHLRESLKVELYGSYPIYLNRKNLLQHPDLLKRFDELRPLKIEITFDATLHQMLVPSKIGRFGTYFNKYYEFNFTKVVKDVELMTVASGKRGENISPGSPSYQKFTGNVINLETGVTANEVEQILSNTFVNTGEISFKNAHISKIELPNRKVKSIYDSLMQRAHGCNKFVDNPVVWTCAEEKTTKDKNIEESEADGFWQNGGETAEPNTGTTQNAANGGGDDFWTTGGEQESQKIRRGKVVAAENVTQEQDGFWSSGSSESKQKITEFWQGGASESSNEDHEIKTLGGQQGVISLSGETLIPFRKWQVESYNGGIARVIEKQYDSDSCEVDTVPRALGWYFSTKGWYYSVSAVKEGYVDETGTWLTPPSKKVYYRMNLRGGKHERYMQVRQDHYEKNNANKFDRLSDRHEDGMAECKDDMRAQMKIFINTYKAKGYVLKSAK
jgi:hypothetical protein